MCYSEKSREKYPTYKDCYVCDKWLRLSGFLDDIEKIDGYELYKNNPNKQIALDKDIKSDGRNKCYCLEQCMFVRNRDNSLQAVKHKDFKYLKIIGKEYCSTKVAQYDKEMNFIRKFNSSKEASEFLGNKNKYFIESCCKGNYKFAYGFIWKYL